MIGVTLVPLAGLPLVGAAFVLWALPRAAGSDAAFAVAGLSLVAAACVGPFFWKRTDGDVAWTPALRAAQASALFGVACVVACTLVAWRRGGPFAASAWAGAFAGLYAYVLGAVGYALGGGPARAGIAVLGCFLLATLFFWDEAFLFDAGADGRAASAARAFDLNPAAAASVTLGFDWIHAKGLYTGSQTAESLVAVPLRGLGSYSAKLGLVGLLAGAAGLWRRP